MYSTVVFDLDGTLLNTLDDLCDSGNAVSIANGWPTHTLDEYRYFVGNGMVTLCRRFSPEYARDDATVMKTLEQYLEIYNAHSRDKTAPYAGMVELLKELRQKGIKIGVFTNKNDEPAHEVLDHYMPGCFDAIRGKVDGVPVKPDATGLHLLMEKLGADPKNTLFVGDSSVDVLTGHNGGLPVCGVLWGFRTREELTEAGADFFAADAGELKELIVK